MWFGINRLRDVFLDRLQCRCCQAAHVGSTPGRRRTGVNRRRLGANPALCFGQAESYIITHVINRLDRSLCKISSYQPAVVLVAGCVSR